MKTRFARWPGRAGSATLARIIAMVALLLLWGRQAPAGAQQLPSLRTLYTFTNGVDGGEPLGDLIASGNTLYGTASQGGASGNGTLFAVNTDGTGFRVLHSFSKLVLLPFPSTVSTNSDGATPVGGVVLSGGVLYGTATYGGTDATGTVFAVNTDGTGFSALLSFTYGADGEEPEAGLILSGGTLYGTTTSDGANGQGTVFAVNSDGSGFRVLHSFNGTDGATPLGSLVLSGETIYGSVLGGGGANGAGSGVVFAVNTDGTAFKRLYDFSPAASYINLGVLSNVDGAEPRGDLVLSGNTLFGTTQTGGTNGTGTIWALGTNGAGFRTLYTFTQGTDANSYSNTDGAWPEAGLVLAGAKLYGTASVGGSNGSGTVFSLDTGGAGFTVCHTFDGTNGAQPWGAMVISGNVLYGTTAGGGGSNGAGTIFAITLAPAPAIDPNSLTVEGGQLQFAVTGVTPGATVYLQTSSDLSNPAGWAPVATNLATGTSLTITGLAVTNAPYRFFRVVETPPP